MNDYPTLFDPNPETDPERKRRLSEYDLMSRLAPLGAEEEEINHMKAQAKRMREMGQPAGRQAGQMYVAANPLEHGAWLLNQYNARYNQNVGEQRRRGLGTSTQQAVDSWLGQQRQPTTVPTQSNYLRRMTDPYFDQEMGF